ncbi:hypothetical protein BB560_002877 [Smittium megazygosporum]|uniref:2Fe-2S ferredoxin-type domain-containing protein n=1 Tax=Smittium megazygosporum TaxID=133381 RepID=A0A2T9ZDL2_9FUNG|nr:hypothetical protein BB560_002877 [Smittium megazygosporum]
MFLVSVRAVCHTQLRHFSKSCVVSNTSTIKNSQQNPIISKSQKKVSFETQENRKASSISSLAEKPYNVKCKQGTRLIDAAKSCGLEIAGICGGKMVCTSCHILLDNENYNKLDPPTEEELDLLDLSLNIHPGLEGKPRLGCQIKLSKNMNGAEFIVPNFSLK